MRPRLRLAACLLLAALAPAAAGAQLAELQPGARVRLRAPGAVAGRLQGVVIARGADSVTVTTPGGGPLQVPLARIGLVEVSRGRSRRDGAVKGLKWGGGIGLALGVLDALTWEPCDETKRYCGYALSRGATITVSTLSGAIVGVGIGALIGTEHWDRLELPARLEARPVRRGVVVTLARAF